MNIRQANSDDASEISNLMKQLGYSASPELIQQNLRSIETNDDDLVLVANSDSGISGVISCHVIPLFHQVGNMGRITSLVINKKDRGHGVGRRLVEAAEAFFANRQCVRYEVTSGDHRSDAHLFYLSCGYQEDERRFIKRVE